jgi:Rieske 2Fe-2S family protein
MSLAEISHLIDSHKDGGALAREFYHLDEIYELEKRAVVFKSWLLAAHVSQIPMSGDYVQFEIAGESLIVCRDQQGNFHGLLNVCRHRGARVCQSKAGNAFAFTCPYHGWVYDLDGALKSARDFDSLDTSQLGLKKLRLAVHHGLIYVSFDLEAADFLAELSLIEAPLSSFDLAMAKVAEQRTYTVEANWKLALENYLECYHCATAHRAYAKSHSLKALFRDVADINQQMIESSAALTGLDNLGVEAFHAYTEAPSPGGGVDCSRYALYEGYVTGSENGKPVAPLMGLYRGFDGGAGDFQFGPLAFMLGYPDHCVIYRFTPRGINETDMTVMWLVKGDAEEGTDYDLEQLTWLWHNTTLEDEYIISRNAAGVASEFFTPGPYHPEHEALCLKFSRWYLQRLKSLLD